MTIGQFMDRLATHGIMLKLDGDQLHVQAMVGGIPEGHMVEIRRRKADLLIGVKISAIFKFRIEEIRSSYTPGAIPWLSANRPDLYRRLMAQGDDLCSPWAEWRKTGGQFDFQTFERKLGTWTSAWIKAIAEFAAQASYTNSDETLLNGPGRFPAVRRPGKRKTPKGKAEAGRPAP